MLRKVEVEIAGRQGKQRGSFHHFVSDQEGNSWAVVEPQDGTVHYTASQTMRFLHPENRVKIFENKSVSGTTRYGLVFKCEGEFIGLANEIDYDLDAPQTVTTALCKLDDGSVISVYPCHMEFLDAK